MKSHIQFLLPSVLRSCLSSVLAVLQCGQNAFAENTFFCNSAVQIILKWIRQLYRKIFKVITRAFIVQFLPFLLHLRMSAMPITFVYREKNNQCSAESALAVTCLQIARAWFLNYGWGGEFAQTSDIQWLVYLLLWARTHMWVLIVKLQSYCHNVMQMLYVHYSSIYTTVHIKLGNRNNKLNQCKPNFGALCQIPGLFKPLAFLADLYKHTTTLERSWNLYYQISKPLLMERDWTVEDNTQLMSY